MHPYVKHKPQQLIVIFYCIMILCQPVCSASCNFAVKKIKIFSDFTKGYVRIENNIVNATKCKDNSNSNMEKYHLYQVTIDKHYMLLYHIKSKKFICWNRNFKRLVAKKNPTNLTYCKFEEQVSKIPDFRGAKIRYTTRSDKHKEVEIRFNRAGAFAKPKMIERCARHHDLTRSLGDPYFAPRNFPNLDPSRIEPDTRDYRAYELLMNRCANPDFLPTDVTCSSYLADFCDQIHESMNNGRSITQELMDLCHRN